MDARRSRHPLRHACAFLAVASIVPAWLFTGVALGYADDAPTTSFFLKRYATFQIRFPDLDDAESDALPFTALAPEQRAAIIGFCKYRFGVTTNDVSAIEACRQRRVRKKCSR